MATTTPFPFRSYLGYYDPMKPMYERWVKQYEEALGNCDKATDESSEGWWSGQSAALAEVLVEALKIDADVYESYVSGSGYILHMGVEYAAAGGKVREVEGAVRSVLQVAGVADEYEIDHEGSYGEWMEPQTDEQAPLHLWTAFPFYDPSRKQEMHEQARRAMARLSDVVGQHGLRVVDYSVISEDADWSEQQTVVTRWP